MWQMKFCSSSQFQKNLTGWCQFDYSYSKKQKHWWQLKSLQMIKTEESKLIGWPQKQYGWQEVKK
jgi:hypothetical protein